MRIKVPKIYLYEKQTLVRLLFYSGMLIAYLGSLNPWFFWSIGALNLVLASSLLLGSMLLARTMTAPFFTYEKIFLPLISYIAIVSYQLMVNETNLGAFLAFPLNVFIFLSLFMVRKNELAGLTDFISKAMGVLMLFSMPFFLLYLVGFPLPSVNAQFRDGYYTFSNYFFFLIDDRFVTTIIPRFQSVFLEPGHLGTATTFLLFTQIGKWKKWYNIILLVATLITFSLSAYLLLTAVVILHLWIRRKHFIGKLLGVVALFAGIITASFFYNDGDNMLHDLIILRLEVEDGDIVGNNRVTEDFQAEFDNFLESSDIFLGRDMDYDMFGNSGYQVFIYENGFIGLFLLIAFYVLSTMRFRDRRAFVSVMFIALLAFLARGYLMSYNYYIPFYCMAYFLPFADAEKEKKEERR